MVYNLGYFTEKKPEKNYQIMQILTLEENK